MAAVVEFGKELECSICLDQYVSPKLLSCMHTFCSNCISKLPQQEHYEDQLQYGSQHCNISMNVACPECRAYTKVFILFFIYINYKKFGRDKIWDKIDAQIIFA